MNHPSLPLMRAYGTDVAFKEKTANVQPIAQRMGEIVMGRALLVHHMEHGAAQRQTVQAEMMNTAFRVLELSRLESAIDNASHTVAPMILPAGYEDMPVGMTEGMVRIASAIGSGMAKSAAPYRTPAVLPKPSVLPTVKPAMKPAVEPNMVDVGAKKLDEAHQLWHRTGLSEGRWKYKLPLLAGGAAAAYGAVQGAKKVFNWLGQEPPPRSYRNGGNQLAPDINQYGAPQPTLPTY